MEREGVGDGDGEGVVEADVDVEAAVEDVDGENDVAPSAMPSAKLCTRRPIVMAEARWGLVVSKASSAS